MDGKRDAQGLPEGRVGRAMFRFAAEEVVRADEERTIEMSVSSEKAAEQWFGTEVLEHTKAAIDMGFFGGGSAPLLLDHDRRQQIGVIERAWLDDKSNKMRARVRFGRGALASEIYDDVGDGIRGNVSIGYRILETVHDKKTDTIRVTKWSPYEASIVSIPADETVGVGRAVPAQAKQEASMPDEHKNDAGRGLPTGEGTSTATVHTPSGPVEVQYSARELEERTGNAVQQRNTEVGEMVALGAIHNMSDVAREYAASGKTLAEFTGYIRQNIPQDRPLRNDAIGLTRRETERFSILRLGRANMPDATRGMKEAAKFEIEAIEAAEAADVSGTKAKGFRMPREVLNNWIMPGSTMHGQMLARGARMAASRDLNTTDEDDLVPTDHLAGSFIDVLRNSSSVMQAGATMLQGLSGNVDIPKKATASSATWVDGEGTAATESEMTTSTVALTPKDIALFTDMTRRIRQQSSPDIENLVRMDIAMAIALAIDLAALEGTAANGQPRGVLNTSGVNAPTAFAGVNPTFAEVIAMETAVADDNALFGNLAYIGRTNMYGALKTTTKDSGSGQFVVEPGGTVNGYPYVRSNQGTDGNLYFGNWSDVLLGMWGTLDLMLDPYALATSGGLRMIAFQTVDVAVRHAQSFAYNNDTA